MFTYRLGLTRKFFIDIQLVEWRRNCSSERVREKEYYPNPFTCEIIRNICWSTSEKDVSTHLRYNRKAQNESEKTPQKAATQETHKTYLNFIGNNKKEL